MALLLFRPVSYTKVLADASCSSVRAKIRIAVLSKFSSMPGMIRKLEIGNSEMERGENYV